MTTSTEDIVNITKKIDYEISLLDAELSDISKHVEGDLDLLLSEYTQQIDKAKLNVGSLKELYRHSLMTKRTEALERAKNGLKRLKEKVLMSTLSEQSASPDSACAVG